MPADVPNPSVDLAALVERLRVARFRIDTRQYLAAHDLLLAMAAAGTRVDHDPGRLAACLGPIFCTTQEEQAAFLAVVKRWRTGDASVPAEPATPQRKLAPEAQSASATPFRAWKAARWPLRVALVLAPFLLVSGAAIGWYYYVPVDVRGKVQVQLSSGKTVPPAEAPGRPQLTMNGSPVRVADDGTFVVRTTRARGVTVQATLQDFQAVTEVVTGSMASEPLITLVPEIRRSVAPPAVDAVYLMPDPIGVIISNASTERRIRWVAVAVSAVMIAVVGFLALWLVDRFRHRLALRALPVHGDPEAVTLTVPDTPLLPISDQELNRVAVSLRRPREGTILDLDIRDTVDDTVRSGGFLQPRYAARRSMPEYLVLISRLRPDDHQARIFDALFTYLGNQDLIVDIYSFASDPRVCTSATTERSYSLREVLERHHRATLIVCAETACAINPVTGHIAPWIDLIPSHTDRIFLTTEAADRWTDREFALERAGFVVLPANDAGWRVLADPDGRPSSERLFPARYTRAFPPRVADEERRWLDRNEPSAGEFEKLLREVKGFLGPDGFDWLCACAVYPEISWPLTLRVKGDAASSVLLSLARLPWFRHGFMPEWLRRALVARIPDAIDQRLRAELEALLEDLARRSSEASGWTLQIGRWLGPVDLIMAAPPASPLQDRVFLGFMTGVRDRLSFDAPNVLRGLFRRRPRSFAREADARRDEPAPIGRIASLLRLWSVLHRRSAHLTAACLVALAAVYPLTRVLALENASGAQDAMWFVEVPEGLVTNNTINSRAFFIGRTEVTVGQYQVCIADGACTRYADSTINAAEEPSDWPVNDVSWNEALEYCAWLDKKLHARPGATGAVADALNGRRDGLRWQVTLPSLSEWQWAAIGGTEHRYPWGNDLDATRANSRSAGFGRRTAVGSFPRGASSVGVLDMAGNVLEWTRTRASQQSGSVQSAIDPSGSLDLTVDARLALGGAFDLDDTAMGLDAVSIAYPQTTRNPNLGFRVVIAPIAVLPTPPLTSPSPSTPAPRPTPTAPPQTPGQQSPVQQPPTQQSPVQQAPIQTPGQQAPAVAPGTSTQPSNAGRIAAMTQVDLAQVIGTSSVALDGRSTRLRNGETNLGDLIADAARAAVNADVAVISSGSIRGDQMYPAGPISRGMVFGFVPFGNVVVKVWLDGRTLLAALNEAVGRAPSVPQISGMRIIARRSETGGYRISNVAIGGRPLESLRTYSIATTDFQLEGGDGYQALAKGKIEVDKQRGPKLLTVVEGYIRTAGTISPRVDGRIVVY